MWIACLRSVLPYLKVSQSRSATNGKLYTISESVFQDESSNFTVFGRFKRIDLDDDVWKFLSKVTLIGDMQSTSTPVSLQYSDNDYTTLSDARTFDMVDYNPYGTNFPRFKRRAWQISYSGANFLRLESLQLKFKIGMN